MMAKIQVDLRRAMLIAASLMLSPAAVAADGKSMAPIPAATLALIQLGPKTTLGDRQTPEGFYAVGPAQMNPNSAYYLSFDIGYPNAFDRARGGSGSYLMVHGTCSSAGCFAMTDKGIAEIYALAREAFASAQQAFQFQAYPFRMTAENMAKHRLDPNIGFWRQLKEGADRFEATGGSRSS